MKQREFSDTQRLMVRHRMIEPEMKTYIDDLRRLSHLVDVVLDGWVVRSDPNDDPVVYTAVDGKADVLCTRDRHFFEPAVIAFCRGNHIRVMNELELLRLLTPRT